MSICVPLQGSNLVEYGSDTLVYVVICLDLVSHCVLGDMIVHVVDDGCDVCFCVHGGVMMIFGLLLSCTC